MILSNNKKNKIELTDYNYIRDIENRLLLAELNATEVEILIEILNGSLKFTVKQLCETLESSEAAILPVLDKLSATKLLQRKGQLVTVDKELRKYYEVQILKFDPDFEPGMEFFQSLLSKVPIHILPNWYSISRSSDHILSSIIEKHLLTPKVYERYLQEISFDEPELEAIYQDVFNAPDYKVSSKDLMHRHALSHEQFEKLMLTLEFSLVCCITYEMIDNKWEEMVTPFHEWRQYLRFVRDTATVNVTDSFTIKRAHPHDFGFTRDMTTLLQLIPSQSLIVEENTNKTGYSLKTSDIKSLAAEFPEKELTQAYSEHLIDRLLQLQLAVISDKSLQASKYADDWLKLPVQDRAFSLYRVLPAEESIITKFSERDVREVEKSLRRVIHSGWMTFDSFFAGMTSNLGQIEAVSLTCKGKRWKYSIPIYSDHERDFVRAILSEKLFESGMVAIGSQEDVFCFSITPFGRMSLGE